MAERWPEHDVDAALLGGDPTVRPELLAVAWVQGAHVLYTDGGYPGTGLGHAVQDGQRVCTREEGLTSCRDCDELWARMPAVAAMREFARVLRSRPPVPALRVPAPSRA